MLRNGTPWFFKRSFDLLPAILFLMASELLRGLFDRELRGSGEVIYVEFGESQESGSISRSA
jgi:hypothetical protein